MAKKSKKAAAEMASPSIASNDDWQHEDNHRTLQRAAEIMSDPAKMKGVKKHQRKQKRAMKTLDDVMKFRNDKYGGKGNPNLEVDNDMDGE